MHSLSMSDETDQFEKLFDAVDNRTSVQVQLHLALENGFIWLARERYRDALALHRKFVTLEMKCACPECVKFIKVG